MLFLALFAVAGPVAAQQVSGELYGEFRYSFNYADHGENWLWGVVNNASRLGVRGEVSGSDVTAFFDLQTGVSIDSESNANIALTNRYYLAGLRGAFGSVAVGRETTPYKAVGVRLDPFYDTSTLSTAGAVPVTGLFSGGSFGLSPLNNGFADRTFTYTSPALYGFTANAEVHVDPESDHDAAGGLVFRYDALEAGVQYYDVGSGRAWSATAGVDDALRAHLSYVRTGEFGVGLSYEHLNSSIIDDSQDFLYAAGRLNVTGSTQLAAAVGHVEDGDAIQAVSGTAVHVGVFHNIFEQVQVHALYSWLDRDDGPDRGNIGVGLIYRFRLVP